LDNARTAQTVYNVTLPADLADGQYTLALALNGEDFTIPTVPGGEVTPSVLRANFSVYKPADFAGAARALQIFPPIAPAAGGGTFTLQNPITEKTVPAQAVVVARFTQTTVSGMDSGPPPDTPAVVIVLCDTHPVKTTEVIVSKVDCVSERFEPALATMTLSLDGGATYLSEDDAYYVYFFVSPVMRNVTPGSGPAYGGSLVKVYGDNVPVPPQAILDAYFLDASSPRRLQPDMLLRCAFVKRNEFSVLTTDDFMNNKLLVDFSTEAKYLTSPLEGIGSAGVVCKMPVRNPDSAWDIHISFNSASAYVTENFFGAPPRGDGILPGVPIGFDVRNCAHCRRLCSHFTLASACERAEMPRGMVCERLHASLAVLLAR
jgi:hypothetical protein